MLKLLCMLEMLEKFKNTDNFITLNNYVKSGKFSHAIMLVSEDSFASLNMAKLLALSIFQKGEIDFNSACAVQVEEQTHADLKFLPEKDNFLVNDAEILQEESFLKPVSADNKIFIIKNIDKSTVQAQNKILKIIEEPPQNVVYIFTCENLENVLQTIKSRVQKFILAPFKNQEIEKFLKCDDNKKRDILALSQGNITKALNFLDNNSIFTTFNLVKSIVLELKSSKNVLEYSSKLIENKSNFVFALETLENIYRDILIFKQGKSELVVYSNIAREVEKEFSNKALLEIIKRINNTKKEYDANVSINLLCDNLLMGILEEKYLWKQTK